MNTNEKKTLQLGEPFGTAQNKLRKIILFNLLKKYKENFCFRCKKEIVEIKDLSIEHKESWLDSDNPIDKFYDLNNIAFSHLSCNCSSANRDYCKTEEFKKKQSDSFKNRFNPQAKLKNTDVLEIRKLCKDDDLTLREIGKKFNISHSIVSGIKQSKRWRHVT